MIWNKDHSNGLKWCACMTNVLTSLFPQQVIFYQLNNNLVFVKGHRE